MWLRCAQPACELHAAFILTSTADRPGSGSPRSGQAWAIHGFSAAYEATGKVLFRTTAQRAADLFLKRLTPDWVPLWDFDAPPSQVGTTRLLHASILM